MLCYTVEYRFGFFFVTWKSNGLLLFLVQNQTCALFSVRDIQTCMYKPIFVSHLTKNEEKAAPDSADLHLS